MLLWTGRQRVVYLPGRAVHHAAGGYRGEGKTDAKDAHIIADQARQRRDLTVLAPTETLVAELGLLVAHRRGLVADRTRAIVQLRELLVSICPALEAALDYSQRGPLLLTCYQTPAELRQAGIAAVAQTLTGHGVRPRRAATLAERAVTAAATQRSSLPAEPVAARLVATLAADALA